jgi:hypothetical protein
VWIWQNEAKIAKLINTAAEAIPHEACNLVDGRNTQHINEVKGGLNWHIAGEIHLKGRHYIKALATAGAFCPAVPLNASRRALPRCHRKLQCRAELFLHRRRP